MELVRQADDMMLGLDESQYDASATTQELERSYVGETAFIEGEYSVTERYHTNSYTKYDVDTFRRLKRARKE